LCTYPAFASLPCPSHNQHYVARLFGCFQNYIILHLKLYTYILRKSSSNKTKSKNIGENDSEITKRK
jgi:hypothetical protein